MQASTGQQSMHTGEPEQLLHRSLTIAMRVGGFLRKSVRPCDIGSRLWLSLSGRTLVNGVLEMARASHIRKYHGHAFSSEVGAAAGNWRRSYFAAAYNRRPRFPKRKRRTRRRPSFTSIRRLPAR
jgi:hypothetical protein